MQKLSFEPQILLEKEGQTVNWSKVIDSIWEKERERERER